MLQNCSKTSIANYGKSHHNPYQQLELFPLPKKRQKPQISSIPGVSPKERDRYRVMIGDRILGDKLTLDEALKLAKHS